MLGNLEGSATVELWTKAQEEEIVLSAKKVKKDKQKTEDKKSRKSKKSDASEKSKAKKK